MNKTQYHKHINNVNNYNNYNYYYNNYYYNGYNYKKPQYTKYNNTANNNNEDRKKNNHYNNNYDENYNDYYYPKKKNYRYNNNYYENNNEEIMSKSVNEIKQNIELIRVKINLKDNKYKELVVYKDDDINDVVNKICNDNFINEKLKQPLINKIKQSLIKLNIVTNYLDLNKDGVVMLEKAKKFVKHK